MRLRSILAGTAVVLVSLASALRVDAGTPPRVMVSVESIGSGVDDVVLTYAGRVSQAQVRQDLEAVGQETGWRIDGARVAPPDGDVTVVELLTTNAIRRSSGRLPVAPLVTALKQYRDLVLAFDVVAPFHYLGNTRYEDHDVAILMDTQVPGSSTYGFRVQVKNPSFSHLNVPETMGTTTHRAGLPTLLLALLAALVVGFISYLALLRLMVRPQAV